MYSIKNNDQNKTIVDQTIKSIPTAFITTTVTNNYFTNYFLKII